MTVDEAYALGVEHFKRGVAPEGNPFPNTDEVRDEAPMLHAAWEDGYDAAWCKFHSWPHDKK